MSKRVSEKILNQLYKRSASVPNDVCFYCGEAAQAGDHVPPLSVVEKMGADRFVGTRFVILPACNECNSKLSNKPITDPKNRAFYLLGDYIVLYSNLLLLPDWHEELYDLNGNLRQYVQDAQDQKLRLERRIAHLEDAPKRVTSIEHIKPYAIDYTFNVRRTRTSRKDAIEHVRACRDEHIRGLLRGTIKITRGDYDAEDSSDLETCD